jgi:hypothetical protein
MIQTHISSALSPSLTVAEFVLLAIFVHESKTGYLGRAIAQAVSRWLPTAAARGSSQGLVMWDLWWTKWRWGRVSPSTSVSPANLHFSSCATIILIHHLGLVQ